MPEEELKNPLDIKDEETPQEVLGNPLVDPRALTILNQIVYLPIDVKVQGTASGTDANYGYFFSSDRAYKIISITERHRTIGSDGGAVTLQIEKLSTGTAKGAGTNLLATAFSLKATANTTQFGSLTTTTKDLFLVKGDSLGLVTSGTLTAVADVQVTVILQLF